MSNKFRDLKNFTAAKIDAFPVEKRRFIVSCSGGVDSTALFDVFLAISKEKNFFSFELFHFNYGLRGEESDGDEAFCRSLAQDNGLPFFCERATAAQHDARGDGGIQEWARALRRNALEKLAQNNKTVIFAHHADDVIETILMRMMRGTSLRSMRGMAEHDGCWWRPWLSISKSDILDAARERALLFREDSSNNQLDYTRNVLRHKVLPPLLQTWPNGGQKMIDLAEDAFTVADFALAAAKQHCSFKPANTPGSAASCSRHALAALPDAVAFLVLSDLIRSVTTGPVRQIRRTNLQKILLAVRDSDPGRRFVLEVSKGIFVEAAGDTVRSFPG